jgi:hypothetical protein
MRAALLVAGLALAMATPGAAQEEPFSVERECTGRSFALGGEQHGECLKTLIDAAVVDHVLIKALLDRVSSLEAEVGYLRCLRDSEAMAVPDFDYEASCRDNYLEPYGLK